MATSKCYYPRPSHRFFSSEQHVTSASDFELNEWDLYNTDSDSASGYSFADLTITSDLTGANQETKDDSVSEKFSGTAAATSSLPINVPDWSKILGEDQSQQRYKKVDVDIDEIACGGETRRVLPHELMSSRRLASFSVHEGAGRTLKGRDLSRVRNTIFKITGFED